MASQNTAIQQLLNAEKKAAEKVADARKRKAKRLKQAKEEAQAEIEAYKTERETQYRQHEQRILGSKGDTESKIEQNTRAKIQELDQNVVRNKELAMKRLLEVVCSIKPELHINFKSEK